jgi:pimeloyl-ACP methyl ester carboxylesterase
MFWVGHSLGGLYVRVFADMFSDQIIGMVLVDATHPDQWTRLANAVGMRRMIRTFAILGHWCARLSVFRIMDGSRFLDAATLLADARLHLRTALARTQHWQAARDELLQRETHTVPQVHESRENEAADCGRQRGRNLEAH